MVATPRKPNSTSNTIITRTRIDGRHAYLINFTVFHAPLDRGKSTHCCLNREVLHQKRNHTMIKPKHTIFNLPPLRGNIGGLLPTSLESASSPSPFPRTNVTTTPPIGTSPPPAYGKASLAQCSKAEKISRTMVPVLSGKASVLPVRVVDMLGYSTWSSASPSYLPTFATPEGCVITQHRTKAYRTPAGDRLAPSPDSKGSHSKRRKCTQLKGGEEAKQCVSDPVFTAEL